MRARTSRDEQLATTVPGTYGSLIGTLRHTVAADASYLDLLAPGEVPNIDEEDALGIPELRATMAACGEAWERLVAGEPRRDRAGHPPPRGRQHEHRAALDPDRPGASTTARTTGRRSAPRSTSLGIEPPEIDVWAYAWKDDRLAETPPTS